MIYLELIKYIPLVVGILTTFAAFIKWIRKMIKKRDAIIKDLKDEIIRLESVIKGGLG